MGRDEDDLREILGSLPPADGEDPRFSDRHYGVSVTDNGASQQIENLVDDFENFVEVQEDPFMPGVVDNDGRPGFRPFVDQSNDFKEQEGVLTTADRDQEDAAGEDDFDKTLRQREEATVGADGRPVSDLLRLAGAQEAAHQDNITAAPYARVNPPTAYRALLGGRFDVAVGFNKPPFQVINWVGDDVEACPCTISISPIVENAGTTYPQIASAFVTWGTRDGVQSVEIDIGRGIQFTIVAAVVYVAIGNPTNIGVPAGNNNVFSGTIRISSSMGYYPTVKDSPLTKTNTLIHMDSTVTTAIIPRPAFASHVYFERSDPTSQWQLDFYDLNGVGLAYTRIITGVAGSNYLVEPVKLSNDVNYVKVTTTAAGGADLSARLMWGLYL